MIATAFAPGSIGNVGPGFDVLGLAVEGIGDTVTVELVDGEPSITGITGRDSELVPADPTRNAASIAAEAWLRKRGHPLHARLSIVKGLPMAGGLGGSAASSVAGAFAAATAAGAPADPIEIVEAALEGEAAVAGRHLDNIAASVFGGLTISRSVDPIDVIPVRVAASWWIALVTPNVRVETRSARAILPLRSERSVWVAEMANCTALAHAFAIGDAALVHRALDDRYAEPLRSGLIPFFGEAKEAAISAGALGCSISGSGPTTFAICIDEQTARACATAMQHAYRELGTSLHVGPVAQRGVRTVPEGRGSVR